jgi:hypothetical protein
MSVSKLRYRKKAEKQQFFTDEKLRAVPGRYVYRRRKER